MDTIQLVIIVGSFAISVIGGIFYFGRKIGTFERGFISVNESLKRLESGMKDLRMEMKDLKTGLESEVKELRTEMGVLRTDMNDVKVELKVHGHLIRNMEGDLKTVKSEMEIVKNEMVNVKFGLKYVEGEIANLKISNRIDEITRNARGQKVEVGVGELQYA